jgi:hypothetical protein
MGERQEGGNLMGERMGERMGRTKVRNLNGRKEGEKALTIKLTVIATVATLLSIKPFVTCHVVVKRVRKPYFKNKNQLCAKKK